MAIEKTIQIGDKPVKLRASASVVRIYRDTFGRDVILDMDEMRKKVQKDKTSGVDFDITENLTYALAKAADPKGVSNDIYEWLDEFDPFALYTCCEEVLTFWNESEKTLSEPKKKADRPPVK